MPSIADKIPGPNWITWAGGIAASIVAIVGLLTMVGIDWPLTEKSPVVEALHETDRNYAGQFQIQELEIGAIKADAKRKYRKDLLGDIRSIKLILSQYEGKPNMTDGDRRNKADLETELLSYIEELKYLGSEK